MALSDQDRELIGRYLPLMKLEWQRMGISEEDQGWIFAGGGRPVSEQAMQSALADFRAFPTGMGAEAYCARLGIDYAAGKRLDEQIRRGTPPTDQD